LGKVNALKDPQENQSEAIHAIAIALVNATKQWQCQTPLSHVRVSV